MMALIFTALTVAMVLAYAGQRRLAVAAITACLLLTIGEFLWEVYSPEYGFRMPWIQVQLIKAGVAS